MVCFFDALGLCLKLFPGVAEEGMLGYLGGVGEEPVVLEAGDIEGDARAEVAA